MAKPLRILFIEDSQDDVLLILREFKKAGYNVDYKRIETRDELMACLNVDKWDVIIADYMLPTFNGVEALYIVKKLNIDIPFIIVSGAIGEEIAVKAMKAGAHDYIIKNNLFRLIPAVERELKDAKVREHDRIMEQQLYYNAFYNSLTNLPNRALLIDRLSQSIQRIQDKENNFFAVIFIDICRFKIINDSLGYKFGDELLVSFSERLKKFIKTGDTIAHLGGDEFIILLENVNKIDDAIKFVEEIKKDLTIPFYISGNEIFITINVGITSSDNDYNQPEEVLRDANTVLHSAKREGKRQHEIFQKPMHSFMLAQFKLETELRKSIDKKELKIYLQPIISLKDCAMKGFEALIRWQHNDKLIFPNDFIPIAEQTGFIEKIDRWLIKEVCKKLNKWNKLFSDYPDIGISINLSGRQFTHIDLVDYIKEHLESNKVSPQKLRLEITENVLIQDAEFGINILSKLHDLGINLFLDDFGTGYSSLNYLLQFPIDAIKIDRSFINKNFFEKKNFEIVKAIVYLAKNLGIKIIAEGIETEDQLKTLQLIGCELGQGFLFSKAIPIKEAESLLKSSVILNPLI